MKKEFRIPIVFIPIHFDSEKTYQFWYLRIDTEDAFPLVLERIYIKILEFQKYDGYNPELYYYTKKDPSEIPRVLKNLKSDIKNKTDIPYRSQVIIIIDFLISTLENIKDVNTIIARLEHFHKNYFPAVSPEDIKYRVPYHIYIDLFLKDRLYKKRKEK